MRHRLPLVILVTGAPGSGKSTLAMNIAEHMRLPHIERDVVLRGIDLTHGDKQDAQRVGIPTYYKLLCHMIEADISLVTDGTMYKGVSEADIKQYLVERAYVVNLHTRANNEIERFMRREHGRTFASNVWTAGYEERLKQIYPDAVDPLQYGVHCIEVDANDGYSPSIEVLAREIMARYDKDERGSR